MAYTIKHTECDYELEAETMEDVIEELTSMFWEDASNSDSMEGVSDYIVYEDGEFYAYANDVIDYDELIKEWESLRSK